MKTVAEKLSFAASPLVLAVALGLLAPNVLLDDEGELGSVRADDGASADASDLADSSDLDAARP